MTDAKPDALEELKRLSDAHDIEGVYDFAPVAIAAWEKEQADWQEAHRQVFEAQQQSYGDLSRLRAAVAKVRNEAVRAYDDALMRHGPIYAQDHLRLIAAALDAALGGGA